MIVAEPGDRASGAERHPSFRHVVLAAPSDTRCSLRTLHNWPEGESVFAGRLRAAWPDESTPASAARLARRLASRAVPSGLLALSPGDHRVGIAGIVRAGERRARDLHRLVCLARSSDTRDRRRALSRGRTARRRGELRTDGCLQAGDKRFLRGDRMGSGKPCRCQRGS